MRATVLALLGLPAFILFGCSSPSTASPEEVCARFDEVGCTADLNGYRDANASGVAEAACVEPADDCIPCDAFWSDVAEDGELSDCGSEVTDLFDCLLQSAVPNGQGVCLAACTVESAAYDDCVRVGELACRKALAARSELSCDRGVSAEEVQQTCVGLPDGCADFWVGVESTWECTLIGDNEFPFWDDVQFPVDTTVQGVVCATNGPP